MTVNDWSNEDQNLSQAESSEVVVGLFDSGDDAHRAIVQLQAEGFSSSQIGAAFRSGTGSAGGGFEQSDAATLGKDVAPLQSAGTIGAGSGSTGARSDTTTVTPTGLSTGAGTPASGLGRLIPEIPTSHIPAPAASEESPLGAFPETSHYSGSMAESARSEIVDTGLGMGPAGVSTERSYGEVPPVEMADRDADYRLSDESRNRTVSRDHESWWDKLKHVFGGGDDDASRETQARTKDKDSQKFGTGEGDLQLNDVPAGTINSRSYEYSDSSFTQSFTGMGIPAERARYLAGELGRGGAIVTVRAGLRVSEAERVLEQNNARIRHETPTTVETTSSAMPPYPGRVEVFGDVQRNYRGTDQGPDYEDRKAS